MSDKQILKPETREMPDLNTTKAFAEEIEKRSGGGIVQTGLMSLDEIADVIVPCKKGYDKLSGSTPNNPISFLYRIFTERGWPMFEHAIVLAGVRKYNIDPSNGFVPFAPGTIDIEAAPKLDYKHNELKILGKERESTGKLTRTSGLVRMRYIVGLATEYGNGKDSLETVIPVFTPGIWEEIKDIQFDRPTGMVIVTQHITLWCEGMSINNLMNMPMDISSVKMLEAIKIMKYLYDFNDIK